jgi:hypothetical protein
MNTYFQKINFLINSNNLDFTLLKGDFCFGYTSSDQSRLDYYYIRNDLKPLVHDLFSNFVDISENLIRFVEVTGPGGQLDPHRDYGVSCAMNYYFCANGATTNWYKNKKHAIEFVSIENRTRVYLLHEIELCDQFTAKNNECYLFNNEEIHSVSGGNGIRQFIQIQYNKPYYEIARLLNLAEGKGIEPLIAESKSAVIPFN